MSWLDGILAKVKGDRPEVVNDSKTPSGRVHVGSLRGVVIHDAVFRSLKEKSVPVLFRYGVDDYDPLDELPAGRESDFVRYLGMPLCNVPPPPGSSATDMADHYIGEFFDVFRELGVQAKTYRMRDIYRSGRFNEPIDAILRNADVVRDIYKRVSNADRPEDWLPFQVICEQCGRIGTTSVTSYDGEVVAYTCEPDLVKWATGCGEQGRVSPFDGNGKLPWKLEWAAKWKVFGVTIEGAGKDHTTRGGSRDVADQVLRQVFGQAPPLNIPYEFFLVDGTKMSSSRGVGASAREMADFLPPELLRFLMLRARPNKPVNFAPQENYIVNLFNDFDRQHTKAYRGAEAAGPERQLYQLSEVTPEGDYYDAPFQLVAALAQMPHLDLAAEITKRKGEALTPREAAHLDSRLRAAHYWLDNYAEEEDRSHLQELLPLRANELDHVQRAFLHRLAGALEGVAWEDDALQSRIFAVARLTPIGQPAAFQAIYRTLLDRDSGPKAGNLLSFLDREFVIGRFQELPFDLAEVWRLTGLVPDQLESWLEMEGRNVTAAQAVMDSLDTDETAAPGEPGARPKIGLGVVELTFSLADGKAHMKRVLFELLTAMQPAEDTARLFEDDGRQYVQDLVRRFELPVPIAETEETAT